MDQFVEVGGCAAVALFIHLALRRGQRTRRGRLAHQRGVDGSARAPGCRGRDDVAVVLTVPIERFKVNRFFHVRTCWIFGGVADVDGLWVFDPEFFQAI